MRAVHWSFSARRDQRAVFSYYLERDLAVAERFLAALKAITTQLARFPASAPRGMANETREAQVQGFPYRLVYRIEAERIVVLSVHHFARDRTNEL